MYLGQRVIEYHDSIVKISTLYEPYVHPYRHPDTLEIVFCLTGLVHVKSAEDEYILSSGQCCTINYGEYHCIFYDEPESVAAVINIDLQHLSVPWEIVRTFFFYIDNEKLQSSEYYEIKDLLIALLLDYYCRGREKTVAFTNALIQALSDNFDWYDILLQAVPLSSRAIFRDRFTRIQDYILTNSTEKIYLKDLAESEHLNESYLSQILGNTEFQGFNNLVNSVRCRRAERYMFESDMSLLEISHLCGFSDPKYFYKYFTKEWGVKPGVYRKWYATFIETPEHLSEFDDDKTVTLLHKILIDHHMEKIDNYKTCSD